jgi:hypothetical protein
MLIDGNSMIEMLGLPEWDDRIIAMLEEFGEDRPVYDPENTTLFIDPEGYSISMMFDTVVSTKKQKEMEGEKNLYFNQIILNNETTILLPFDIKMQDSYEAIRKKLEGKAEAEYKNKNEERDAFYWLLNDGDKKYFINIFFTNSKLSEIETLSITLYKEHLNYRGLIPLENQK